MTAVTDRPRRVTGGRLLLYGFLISLLLVFALPLLWALSSSFKSRSDIFSYPPQPLPAPAVLDNYRTLLAEQPFWSWFVTSTVVALLSTVLAVGLCSLAGFAFAKYRFRGKTILFNIMFSSLAVPFAVIVVPLFIMIAKARLTEPYFALVVPWIAPAFGIFMMRQFAEQAVPDALLDAARMDGCTEFGLFRRVVLPLLRPALGALGVWSFLNSYNSLIWPLIVISEPGDYTLPLGIQALFGATGRQYDLVLAGSVLAAVPSLLVFFLLRRQLLEGLAAGAVKS
ncbi:multiple sugar transport system permease protein/arabinosaccharide transport system permease protein [Actinoalloteichus hoggarensis]|uniref:L-arabinose transport system permease protein AraQ n=1 Tax=Actinoalloteichus hoggarensis TaxID=1470176 RepID=A0A221W726_9PSEU|nr:carbohydrate ABC transporter permease [Actinoalloteichus hoggarensis]ASO21685.1 L-arabinose transport system permease protein AraQ [Actinoalloteichus hoggarensis]MBB5922279.1 multiple sugar transport system permease protein/arabinosaccharide transport system permease protein [Actinoalloteichus hoggarensis]